eukprot:CAMPEP_0183360494 /NCGR_PEP_ID=MMETSP0164_2-20130417/55316_1 /TAXON_ID=221442 /ORGANISM="Coccolithus pelagicus ssp braarudi, Strain PLY182g" /LENGTH=139 /DNA_ID=CAMNT_0025534865 /DNA_START=34 /DNA_END=453 /DNA_ORIENTATION=+
MQCVAGATFHSDASGGTWDARRGTWDAARGTWDFGRRRANQMQHLQPLKSNVSSLPVEQLSQTTTGLPLHVSSHSLRPFSTGRLGMSGSVRKPLSEPLKIEVRTAFPCLTRGGRDPTKWDLYAQRSADKILARQRMGRT